MKKLILLTCLLLTLAVGVRAQSVNVKGYSTTNGTTKDTVTNTGVRSQVLAISNATKAGIQVTITKLTGTGAGQVNLLGSVDGVGYERIPSIKSNGVYGLDSLTVTNNATSSHTFQVRDVYHNFFKLTFTGSGTETALMQSVGSAKQK